MKNEEIKSMSDKELREAVSDTRKEIQKMRFMTAISSVENTAAFKIKRKDVARMLTEVRRREMEKSQAGQ